MKGLEFIQKKQVAWAISNGLVPVGSTFQNEGKKNYLEKLEDNLFLQRLTDKTQEQLNKGDGGELKPCCRKGKHYREKIKALHSSAAIVVNTFDYWRNKDVYPILYACGLCEKDVQKNPITHEIIFEDKRFKIINNRFSPNIDIVINNSVSTIYAIESKFTEPYNGRKQKKLNQYYYGHCSWDGLENLFDLAKKILLDNEKFKYLDAAQLMTHILGLKKTGKEFRLLYLWYDVIGEDGVKHRKEIEEFARIVKKDNINFSHITYQEMIMKLAQEFYIGNEECFNYLKNRYL